MNALISYYEYDMKTIIDAKSLQHKTLNEVVDELKNVELKIKQRADQLSFNETRVKEQIQQIEVKINSNTYYTIF